jgi:hypothetical protein
MIPIIMGEYLGFFYIEKTATNLFINASGILISSVILAVFMRFEGLKLGGKEYFQVIRLSITNAEKIIAK